MTLNRDTLLALVTSALEGRNLSISALEKHSGLGKDSIRDFLRGKTHLLRSDKMEKLMAYLQPPGTIAVSGYVGENAQIFQMETPLYVECPAANTTDLKAVVIKGDAMLPLFHDNWIVYYSTDVSPSISPSAPQGGWQVPYNKPDASDRFAEFLGKPCIIQLADGRMMLRTIRASLRAGYYDLISYNAPDVKEVEIENAWKIAYIKTV